MSLLSPNLAVSIATAAGILVSAIFVMWELGHYTTPQVTENRFDERREIFGYTVGLFVGILLTVPFTLFLYWFAAGSLVGTLLFLAIVVGFTELAQWAIRRTRYWGEGPAFPFYAVGLRCGIAGLLMTTLFGQALEASTITWDALTVAGLESVALLMLMVVSSLLSLPPDPKAGRTGGGPISGGIILFVGLFLVGFNAFAGELTGAIAAIIALAGAVYLYRRVRPILERIRPIPPPQSATAIPSRYARTEPRDPKSP